MSDSMSETPELEASAKLILDLDRLIQAMRSSVRPTKPWQRSVLGHLADLDRQVEVLRLAIMLERNDSEIMQAAEGLVSTLALRDAQLARGRADETTRAAFKIALGIARRIPDTLTKLAKTIE